MLPHTANIPVVALLDIGTNAGCKDAAANQEGQQAGASNRDGSPGVVIIVDGSICAH